MALDPPRHRLQHRVAHRAAERFVDRIVAGEADQQHDRAALLRPFERPRQPGERGAPVAQGGQRIAPLVGRVCAQLLGAADDLAALADADMMRDPAAAGERIGMGEGGRRAGPPHPADRVRGRSPPFRIELAHEIEHADPARPVRVQPGLGRQRGAELHFAPARLPAPGRALLSARPRRRPIQRADPLRMAAGEGQRVQELGLGDRADEEMGRAETVEAVERRAVVARDHDQQRRPVRLGAVGQRAHRLEPFVERAARIDDRDIGAGAGEARLGIVCPPRRDRPPAAPLGEPVQLVAMAEGQDEERRGHVGPV